MKTQLNIKLINSSKKLLLLIFVVLFIFQSRGQQNIASKNTPTRNLESACGPNCSSDHLPKNPSYGGRVDRSETQMPLCGNGMSFIPNKGQIADMDGKLCPDVLYKADRAGADIYLRNTGISYVVNNIGEVMHEVSEQMEQFEKDVPEDKMEKENKKKKLLSKQIIKIQRIDVDFVNCSKNVETYAAEQTEGFTNYYYAHCPQGIMNVNSFNEVTQKNIYNNIDVKYYSSASLTTGCGKEKGLKYDIIVNPGGDPGQIKLKYSGTDGLTIKNGKLKIKTSTSELGEYIPRVYQNINGKIVDVKARYLLNGAIVNFELGTWNLEFPLVIDPWLSYYGGSSIDFGTAVTTDPSGNAIFIGGTTSLNLPGVAGTSFQPAYKGGATFVSNGGIGDIFIVKMNANGNLLWATYYGGTNDEYAWSVAADATGNIFVAGNTNSANFPVSAAPHQNTIGGAKDAFLLNFSPAGTRLWATYYGGSSDDIGNGVTTDGSNVYLYGNTQSSTAISTAGSFQSSTNGGGDAFVVKFSPAGSRMWGTYVGGTGGDFASGIACDIFSGNIYIGGGTTSADFPVFAGHQMIFGAGIADAFLFKFSPAGLQLWSTYYGGSAVDQGLAVATDGLGNVILVGNAQSTTATVISTSGSYQPVHSGGNNGMIVKFNSSGIRQWGTYIGGSNGAFPSSVTVDINNNIYVLGEWEDTNAGNYPISACAFQPVYGGVEDQFIAKYDPNGMQKCVTYLGGTKEDDLDSGGGIATYGNFLYVTGYTLGGYPVTGNAYQTVYSSGGDAFIDQLCINLCEAKVLGLSYSANATSACANTPVTFTPSVAHSCDTTGYKFQWTFTGGTPASSNAVNPTVAFSGMGNHDVKLVVTTVCKKDSLTKTNYITVNGCGCTLSSVATTTANVSCNGGNTGSATVVISNGSGGPYIYSWSNGSTGTTTSTTIPVTGLPAATYIVTVSEGACTSTSTIIITQPAALTSITNNVSPVCANASGQVSVTPGGGTLAYTYLWLPGGAVSQTVTNLAVGNYSVTVTDSKGCTTTSTATITAPPPLIGQFTKGSTNCISCGCKEWIMVTAAGGTSPYSYSWPDGYNKRYKNHLCTGAYTINIKDKNGCSVNVNLTAP